MSELSDLYQEMILDHSRKPHNYHPMADATRKAEGYNPLCGDQVTIYVKLDKDRIREISFEGNGCAISKASASVMTDVLKDKTSDEARAMVETFRRMVTDRNFPKPAETDKLAVFSGVAGFPTRVKCAVLAWHTLKSALEDKREKVSTE